MNGSFLSGGQQVARYLAKPAGRTDALPGLILCHGFPVGPIDARHSGGTFPELIDRAALVEALLRDSPTYQTQHGRIRTPRLANVRER